jgi:phenylacetic acid degradation operon negative regulatory protein
MVASASSAESSAPREHLPGGWPAEGAQRMFRALHADLEPAARAIAADVLHTIPDEAAEQLPGGAPAAE